MLDQCVSAGECTALGANARISGHGASRPIRDPEAVERVMDARCHVNPRSRIHHRFRDATGGALVR